MARNNGIPTSLRPGVALVGLLAPGLVLAHGGDHLHFWGAHSAEGQGLLLGGALAALAGLAWWFCRGRG